MIDPETAKAIAAVLGEIAAVFGGIAAAVGAVTGLIVELRRRAPRS